jgi:hypothetical protein
LEKSNGFCVNIGGHYYFHVLLVLTHMKEKFDN